MHHLINTAKPNKSVTRLTIAGTFLTSRSLTGTLLASILLNGCASIGQSTGETGTLKVDPNNVGLSVQYDLADQKFKLKPFYSPSAQTADKPNLIKPTHIVTPSSYADPENPVDIPPAVDPDEHKDNAPIMTVPAKDNTP